MVMAVYNGELFLKEALDSALDQTYTNIEIIIINDGSTDSTKSILDGIDDERVKVIHLEVNQGAANALNIGISQAKGSWIAIQDADDNSYPTRIEEQVQYILQNPQLVGVGTFIECIPGNTGVSERWLRDVEKSRNSVVSKENIREIIYWGCPFTHSSVMFSKDIFWEVGGYNRDFKIAYDYDLWLRLLEKGDMENVPKVLLQYRVDKKSLSNRNGFATVKEIQMASSRGIYRLLYRWPEYQPKVIVIGSQRACKNYNKYVARASGLKVNAFIDKEWHYHLPSAIKKVKEGKVDAIIVLDRSIPKNITEYLQRNDLKRNVQVFNIYSL